MRFQCTLTAVALVVSAAGALSAQEPRRNGWSRGSFPARALVGGAVYELRLRLPEKAVATYLARYARWFLPVDQGPNSGRKLLSVLSREHGDQYNIVFLYTYDDEYKHNYYCQYRKAFFDYHSESTRPTAKEFLGFYRAALKESGRGDLPEDQARVRLTETVARLRADCTEPGDHLDDVELAEDTIMLADHQLAELVELDEGTWNFGVNLCEVAKLFDAGKEAGEKLQGCANGGPPSMLERALELKWPLATQESTQAR
jgi:hypothetical protein